jgi:hypothetical protein
VIYLAHVRHAVAAPRLPAAAGDGCRLRGVEGGDAASRPKAVKSVANYAVGQRLLELGDAGVGHSGAVKV